jgi:hypothetical protein
MPRHRCPGGKPYNPATLDSTKIDGGLVSSSGAPVPDSIWYFAQYCMTYGRLNADKLVLWPEDVRTNGKTLGGFVTCIMNFYQKKVVNGFLGWSTGGLHR